MNQLKVSDCLLPKVVRVLDEGYPAQALDHEVFAVFQDSLEQGVFCGLATVQDISTHPNWIFADLSRHRPLCYVSPDASLRIALQLLEEEGLEALSVLDAAHKFVGVVTRQSILAALLKRDQVRLLESVRHMRLLENERKQALAWSKQLADLNDASRALLGVLANTSAELGLLSKGIEALAKLLQARYGAIGLLNESGELKEFVYTGISPEQAQRIGHLPEGKGLLGLVIDLDACIRLDDIGKDKRSVGFPAHHPPMKSLLAVPISQKGRVFGRIYLCDKLSGEAFSSNDEMLANSFAHSLSLVLDNAHEIEEIKKARRTLDYMAHFDALTGLPNRSLFSDRIHQALTRAHRNEGIVAILFIDLDNFKMINDALGHTLGDKLLKQVAGRIVNCIREEDAAARFGGDEFLVLLADISDPQDAAKVANKLINSLAQGFVVNHHDAFVSASIGISIFPSNGSKMEDLLAAADSAMYHAKKLGKNNYQFFTAEMNSAAQHYLKLEKHLHGALENNELELHYQPQVDAQSGQIIGMEALLRWHNPELGPLSPVEFIPFAEETGLIIPIGAWVLNTACQQAQQWRQMGLPVRISVNISGRQFHCHHNQQYFLQTVLAVLDNTGLPKKMLELEITESIIMHDLNTTLQSFDALNERGVRISVDDFGTGYSSLSYLKRFPIDTLKIDKSFINDIVHDPDSGAIVAAILAMAHQLKLEVVAEGVETSEQLAFLREMDCRIIQGNYFSQPLPAEAATSLMQQGCNNGSGWLQRRLEV
jgi:diguanylate cyclase (GGDEF)-like protein